MNQKTRLIIGVVVLLVLAGVVMLVDSLQRKAAAAVLEENMQPGDIPIYVDGKLTAAFSPTDLENLEEVSFVDNEDGKTQQGWLLGEVLEIHVPERKLKDDTSIVVSSSSREKSITLSWPEVENRENMVMFDLSGRGTLKLVSKLEQLDVRDEWVQDVDKVEVNTP